MAAHLPRIFTLSLQTINAQALRVPYDKSNLYIFEVGHNIWNTQYACVHVIDIIVQRKLYCLKLEKACDTQLYTEQNNILNKSSKNI